MAKQKPFSAVKKAPPIKVKHILLAEKFEPFEHEDEDDKEPQDLPVGKYQPIASKGKATTVKHKRKAAK